MLHKKLIAVIALMSVSLIASGSGWLWVRADLGDLSDTLLLYDATDEKAADNNFRKISEYYGLKWAEVDLSTTILTNALLRDESGQYYRTIGIDVGTLIDWLDSTELAILEQAVDDHGANLLVTGLYWSDYPGVQALTDGEVTGSTDPSDDIYRDFIISDEVPEVSREFTDQMFVPDRYQYDYALTVAPDASHVEPIISATDDISATYHIFAKYQDGMGSIFLQSRNLRRSLEDTDGKRMEDLYRASNFTEIVPLMMFVRYSAGEEAWHNNHDYANLTIDDPSLAEPFGHVSFDQLLAEMETHDFHTTIGFVPKNYDMSEPYVVDLFLDNPQRYSLVVHGNNHSPCPEFTPDIPREEKEADLIEAESRMRQHENATSIPYGMVMIFPCRLSGLETLVLLKAHNFNVTVNGHKVPIGATASTGWDRNMYLANLDYSNFATVARHHASGCPYLFDLFRDKPVLIYEHESDFASGIDYFNPYADAINGAEGEVEWKSLGYIAKHLYLEKTNDDNSIDVKMYGNNLVVKNATGSSRIYHIRREETLNVPILSVLVDGGETDYAVADGMLQIDLEIAASSSKEILIIYGGESTPPPSLELTSGYSVQAYAGDVVTFTHTLTNTGSGLDGFVLTTTPELPGWTAVASPTIVGPLDAGHGDRVSVAVHVPSDAVSGTTGSVLVVATSQTSSTVSRAVTDTVTVLPAPTPPPSLELTSGYSVQAYAGDVVTFTHTLTNTGSGLDGFVLTTTPELPGWTVVASPTIVGPLDAGHGGRVSVAMHVPSDAVSGTTGSVLVVATSQTSSTVSRAVTDTVTVLPVLPGGPWVLYLPLVLCASR
jgi:hypothetical protein